MQSNIYIFSAIVVMGIATAALRFAPFVVFGGKTPRVITYLGTVLPDAIIALLVVYCLRNVSLFGGSHGIPEAIALAVVYVLHKWKHNVLLSILGGTILYMVLVQLAFV